MARARMITNQICRDKAVHNLSDDLSRLAFTWLITFADCEGRVFGDPAIIRATLFPRREDITIEQMTAYVTEWSKAGLIIWYECDGDQYICFPKFEKHQPGLRKDREPHSDIPDYLSEDCRIIDGCLTDECRVKLREVKLREIKLREEKLTVSGDRPELFRIYENEIGALTPIIASELMDAEKEYPPDWFALAFKEAATHNKRSWGYARAILKRWKVDGVNTNHKGKDDGLAGIKFDNVDGGQ